MQGICHILLELFIQIARRTCVVGMKPATGQRCVLLVQAGMGEENQMTHS